MICSRSCAVLGWMTRFDGDGAAGVYWPAELVVPSTRVGWTRTPPLAIVAYTSAIWIAVTAPPRPNDSVYRVSGYQLDSACRPPAVSPGSPMPVGWPRPNALRESYCTC